MSLQSTYQLRHSLPNRSNSRPRSLSLAEYQPLSFDREALEAAYQESLNGSSGGHASSWRSHPSQNSGRASTEKSEPAASTLSRNLRPGDNPHLASQPVAAPPSVETIEEAPPGGIAGVGAGHSLTPPHSPFHKQGQLHSRRMSSGLPTPMNIASEEGHGARQGASQDYNEGLDMDDLEAAGYDTDPGPVVSGRRALPQPPTNVPPPELPAWEPDYKPHIPPELTQPSIANAYAQLSAPPPNLPPRPNRGGHNGGSSSAAGPSNGAGTSNFRPMPQTVMSSSTIASGSTGLHPGVSAYPPPSSGGSLAQSSNTSMRSQPRPEAEKEVVLRATDRTPIWSTHFLDPCLREGLVGMKVPQQVSSIANAAMSGFNSGSKENGIGNGGTKMDELARMAKEWVAPPDGRFQSENGGVEIGLGVIDSGLQGWGRDKGRQRARVEVLSKSGGIKVEVLEIDTNRQLELKIESRTGDILVLLPQTFQGPIQVTSPFRPPIFLSSLSSQLLPVSSPYASQYSTFAVPAALVCDGPDATEGGPSQASPTYSKTNQSKLLIASQKGRVVVGYRETKDETAAQAMNLKVGAQGGGKKKRWWKG